MKKDGGFTSNNNKNICQVQVERPSTAQARQIPGLQFWAKVIVYFWFWTSFSLFASRYSQREGLVALPNWAWMPGRSP